MGQSTELILEAEIRALNAELVRVEAERTAAERTVRDLLDFFLKNDAVHSHGVSPGNHCLSGSCEFDTAKVKIAVLEARLSEVNNLNLQLLHLLKPSEWDVGKISRITGSSNSSLNGVQMSHQQPAVDSIDSFSSLLDSPSTHYCFTLMNQVADWYMPSRLPNHVRLDHRSFIRSNPTEHSVDHRGCRPSLVGFDYFRTARWDSTRPESGES